MLSNVYYVNVHIYVICNYYSNRNVFINKTTDYEMFFAEVNTI